MDELKSAKRKRVAVGLPRVSTSSDEGSRNSSVADRLQYIEEKGMLRSIVMC